MAYRPQLRVKVEWGEATFWFVSPDSALARFGAAVNSLRGMAAGELAVQDTPPELAEAMADMFVEGVDQWAGVEDEQGQPLRCTASNRRAIPFADKIEIVQEYLMQTEETMRGKAASPPAPTNSMPPDAQADAPSSTTPPPLPATAEAPQDAPPL